MRGARRLGGRRLAGVLVAAAVAAGCGSTVQPNQRIQSVAGGLAGTGSGAAGDQGAGSGGQAGAAAGAGVNGGAGALGSVTAGDANGSGGSGGGAAVLGGNKVAAGAPVEVGFAEETDITAYAGALGISGVNAGDPEAQLHAIVNSINAHGGLAGHQIVIVEYNINTEQRVANAATVSQAACADWTQDHKVYAVVDSYVDVATLPGMLDCLNRYGVPLVSDWPTDDANNATYASHPLFASPSSMTVDSYIPAEVDRLYARGFFTGWNTTTGTAGPAPVKVGTQSFDDPGGQHYVAVLRAALARHGLTLDAVESHNRDDPSAATAGSSSAVLKFRSEGITHVFYANIAFYEDAQSQAYHPRYDVNDLIGPQLLAQNVGASQLHGAMGAGYQPYAEVTTMAPASAASAACLAVMKGAGQVPNTQIALESMLGLCSHWDLLATIVAHAPALNAAAFRNGTTGLGTSWLPPDTYSAMFGATHMFGADKIRDYTYVDSCACFEFTSPTLYPAG